MSKRLIAAGIAAALISTILPAYAGTTGSLKGRVTDAATGAPLAGAGVTAISASQSVNATTDASGGFIFVSLSPDTYTVTASKDGYDSQSQPGETIQADQSSTLSLTLTKALKTIGVTHSRSAGNLVRSGTTSDVYAVNASAQKATKALGGSGSLDQAYGALASVPGVSIPSGQQGWYQSVFIRGGDYDQVAYEFDGIPVIRESDGAPIVTLSNLGQQEVQVYTGGTPATSNSPGLAGYINQVIKTGTFPGYGQASFGIGAPTFYHKLSVEAGGASPDRLFSYYIGLAGDDQSYRYGDQFNGVSDPLYYYPLNIPTSNGAGFNVLDGTCGDPTLSTACPGPSYGSQFSTGNAWTQSYNADREAVMNVHIGIPHKHDGGKDDIQMLYVTGNIATQYYSSANDIGAPQMSYLDASVANGGGYYTGPLFQAPDPNAFADGPFPSEPPGAFGSNIGLNQRDGGSNGYSIEKFQYQRNINSRSYLRAIGYSEYTNWFLNGPNSANQLFGATLADYEVIGNFYGGSLVYSNALSDKHLLTASVSYETQKLQTYNATFDTTYGDSSGQFGSNIADLTDGTHCYDPTLGTYTSCYGSAVSVISPGNVPSAPAYTCPNALIPACTSTPQYLVTENGQNAQVDNVTPNFSSIAVTDVYRPDDRWTFNIGARLDHFAYRLDNLEAGYPARAFWFNAYNNEHCWATGVADVLATIDPSTGIGQCPTGTTLRATSDPFVDSTGGSPSQNVFQPRLAFTYAAGQNTVWRGSFGVYARPAATSYQEYNTYQQDLPSFMSQFAALGYTSPVHDVRADTSNNFDISYERHFPGTKFTLKASPFYRTTSNQLQYLNISALGGTLAGINVGTLTSSGLEVALQYGDYSQDGLSGQLSYTHTSTHTRYKALPNGLNLIDVLNESIEQYNSYTSACAGAAAATKACGSGNLAWAGNAQPTLVNTQAPVSSGTTGTLSIPNPYYNSPIQQLMDPNGSYVPYDVIPSAFASANSYAVPDVATLVLNWKHKNLTITPSVAFTSGSYYGSPLSVPGYVPQACSQLPNATVIAGAASPTTPGASCDSVAPLFVPDPYTGSFDSLGSLKEPWQLTGNLQIAYDLNPRMSVTVIASNIFNKCYQHGYAWDTSTACWYSSLPSNILPPNGPGTQPGAFLTNPPQQLAYPYGIWFNNTQVGITSARQPFQLTVNLDIKL